MEAIGGEAVNSTGGQGPEPAKALRFIRREARSLQTKGWYWNTTRGTKLLPDRDGKVAVPSDALSVSVLSPSDRPIIARAKNLFDLSKNSATIGEAVTADIVRELTWVHLPEAAQIVATDAACRRFQMATVGNSEYRAFDEYVLREAQVTLQREEINTSRETLLGTATLVLPTGRRVVGWP